MTVADVVQAQRILRSWRSRAKAQGNKQALADVEHIMRVLGELYAE